ncbi:uncharacterized protein B0H64DRAFT_412720 [Chaetomium fimeti]|uniref:Uncharacterized protein n=1 Tax=Chaetomium fimeti TaxID=1854472 RepID=A0AAE0LME8_9PEZI|nr:hypothetical protein B0H64DRAFT_412720 [Chaetomium fimeti]
MPFSADGSRCPAAQAPRSFCLRVIGSRDPGPSSLLSQSGSSIAHSVALPSKWPPTIGYPFLLRFPHSAQSSSNTNLCRRAFPEQARTGQARTTHPGSVRRLYRCTDVPRPFVWSLSRHKNACAGHAGNGVGNDWLLTANTKIALVRRRPTNPDLTPSQDPGRPFCLCVVYFVPRTSPAVRHSQCLSIGLGASPLWTLTRQLSSALNFRLHLAPATPRSFDPRLKLNRAFGAEIRMLRTILRDTTTLRRSVVSLAEAGGEGGASHASGPPTLSPRASPMQRVGEPIRLVAEFCVDLCELTPPYMHMSLCRIFKASRGPRPDSWTFTALSLSRMVDQLLTLSTRKVSRPVLGVCAIPPSDRHQPPGESKFSRAHTLVRPTPHPSESSGICSDGTLRC